MFFGSYLNKMLCVNFDQRKLETFRKTNYKNLEQVQLNQLIMKKLLFLTAIAVFTFNSSIAQEDTSNEKVLALE